MKKLLQKPAAWGLALVLAAGAAAPACAAVSLPDLPADQCVVDAANVLSDDTAAYIDQLNGQLEASCQGAQIGVLTVDYTGSATTEEYALEAFNTWGVGNQDQDNGILLLLVMESPLYADGDYYLTYGDGFRNTTVERQASPLAQTMESDFAAKDYDGAVQTCAAAVADVVADVYGVSLTGDGSAPAPEPDLLTQVSEAFGAIVLGFIFLLAVIMVARSVMGNFFPFCFGWCLGSNFRGPRPPSGPRPPRRGPPPPPPPRPPRGGGFGGMGGGSFGGGFGRGGFGGGFGGGGFGGGGFGGMGGGSSHGGGGGRGR